MALTPDEEKKLRDEIRKELSERETRMKDSSKKEESKRLELLESRIRQQIVEEEEEKYFKERGYVKYINRHGSVEWLMPEEARQRAQRRRSKKSSSYHRRSRNRKMIQWFLNAGMIIVAGGVFLFLLRYNNIGGGNASGAIYVKTDIPGARVFINAAETMQYQAPDTIASLNPGAYFVSVYKDGFTAWPPMQRVTVTAGDLSLAEFTLKNAGSLGKIHIESNEPDFKLFVDGILCPPTEAGNYDVPAGYRVISAIKEGFIGAPVNQRVLVPANGMITLKFTFENDAEFGYLEVTSNHSSAYVFLNNSFFGMKANTRFPVKTGVYEVRLCQNGYHALPPVELVRITAGEIEKLSFHMKPETLQDTLQIITKTPGANIIIDGAMQPFVTPVLDLILSEGVHYLNLMRDGRFYSENEIKVDVVKLEDTHIVVDF